MKTLYFLVVLAVIFVVFAVCCFDTTKTWFLRKPFSQRNNNFWVLRFFRISADPASGAHRKHSQASGLPKPIPLGIPRPISPSKICLIFSFCFFVRFYTISIHGIHRIWSISASCRWLKHASKFACHPPECFEWYLQKMTRIFEHMSTLLLSTPFPKARYS